MCPHFILILTVILQVFLHCTKLNFMSKDQPEQLYNFPNPYFKLKLCSVGYK